MNELSFFSQQSRMSDPGTFTTAVEDLPGAIAELVRVVQGLTIHVFWTERYGFSLPPERRAELQLRSQPGTMRSPGLLHRCDVLLRSNKNTLSDY